MTGRTVVGWLAMLPIALAAQAPGMPDGSRERAAIAPLAKLVGVWEGDASAMVGPGQMHAARQREEVSLGAGGTVLIIRGTGRLKEDNRVVHDAAAMIWFDAAAMIWFDAATNKLKMRAHRMEGISIEPDLELKGDTLVWGFALNGGRVRYTTVFSDTDWHEVGQFIREGMAPVQMMEMRLKKLK